MVFKWKTVEYINTTELCVLPRLYLFTVKKFERKPQLFIMYGYAMHAICQVFFLFQKRPHKKALNSLARMYFYKNSLPFCNRGIENIFVVVCCQI